MTQREKLIILRDKAGMSQQVLADRLGVSRQAVTRWESGETSPTMDKMITLSKIYGVSLDWLCSEKGIEEQEEQHKEETEKKQKPIKKKMIVLLAATVIILIALGTVIGIASSKRTNGTKEVSIDNIPGEAVNITDSDTFALK